MTTEGQLPSAMTHAEAMYRALVEQVPAVVYIDAVDERSTALYSSPQVERMLGYSPEEWTSDPDLWLKLLHEEDRARVLTASVRSNHTGEPFSEEYRLTARDGRIVWVRDEAVMVRDENGAPRCWQGVMVDVTERKRTEENLERSLNMLRASDDERRRLLGHLVQAQEEERERISAEIHDDALQVLVALGIRLEMLERWISDPDGISDLRETQGTLRLAVDRLRNLLFDVRPPLLDREGLGPAIRLALGGLRVDTGIACTLEDRLPAEPPHEIRTIVYRIAAEALANVRKHAKASSVTVRLEERDGGVLLSVTDDGGGFAREHVEGRLAGHYGLVSMRERAAIAGGWCRIDTGPGEGTSVEAWVPAAGPARSLAS